MTHRNHQKKISSSAGLSLIETLVYVAVFSMIMLTIVSTLLYLYRTNDYAIEQASAVSSAQRGLDHIVREIREAAYASNGAYPIVSFSPNEFVFYADVDSDPFIEKVRYFMQGTALKRGVTDPVGDPPQYTSTEVVTQLSDNVRNVGHGVPVFVYYDNNGTQITDYTRIGDVRFVSVSVQVDVDPSRSPTPFLIRSSAALRNLQ